MNFKDKKVLVVGGAGFVGSNLVRKLLQTEKALVTVVDNLISSEVTNLPVDTNLNFIYGSISDDRILMSIEDDYDFVFHLATYHGNQSSMIDPIKDHQNNNITTLKLCEHFKQSKNLKKMVYSSAGCTVAKKTFDEVNATHEDSDISLYHDSPYQISKIVGEMYGNYYWMKHDLPFVKARFQNVYGPGEVLGAGQWRGSKASIWRNVIPSFIWRSLHNEELPLERGGLATRDFIFVDDIVDGLIACASLGKPGDVYNLASGVETSIKELALKINDLTGNKTPVVIEEARDWDRSGKRFGSTDKSELELDFKADVSLTQGLELTVQWFKDNHQFIVSQIQKHAFYVPGVLEYS